LHSSDSRLDKAAIASVVRRIACGNSHDKFFTTHIPIFEWEIYEALAIVPCLPRHTHNNFPGGTKSTYLASLNSFGKPKQNEAFDSKSVSQQLERQQAEIDLLKSQIESIRSARQPLKSDYGW